MPRYTKTYDEMTDRDVYMGTIWTINLGKAGTAEISLKAACYFTDESEVDAFWLLFQRTDVAWHWSGDTSGILLVDEERFAFTGELAHAKTFRSQSSTVFRALDDSAVQIFEEVHAIFEPELVGKVASATRAKVRLGSIDFELPQGLLEDAGEIYEALKRIGQVK